MAGEMPEPMEAFEVWLLRRVAQAVEAGEVSADLLAELQAEFAAARKKPQQQAHVAAIQHIADIAKVDEAVARPHLVFPPHLELKLAGTRK